MQIKWLDLKDVLPDEDQKGLVGMVGEHTVAVVLDLGDEFGYIVYALGPPHCYNTRPCSSYDEGKRECAKVLTDWLEELQQLGRVVPASTFDFDVTAAGNNVAT